MSDQQVKDDLTRFFQILETKEVSDNETEFYPVTINSCRVMLSVELSEIFARLKEYAKQ